MKKSLFIITCLFSSLAVAQADTIDLLENISTGSGTVLAAGTDINNDVSNVTTDYVTNWLGNQSVGVYATVGNNNNTENYGVNASFSSSEEGYTLSFTNRNGYHGSVVGFVTSLGDTTLTDVTNLTFSYTGITTNASGNSVSGELMLVYQIDGEWTSSAATFSSGDTSVTVNVDLTGTLTSSTVYALVVTENGGGSTESGTIALTATTTSASVPEPATASLSLLGLGALLLRRRRR